ncbi:MAG: DUF4369 domain-containing protein [Alistipes onderdonkii]
MKKLFLFATAAAVLCSCSNQPKYIIDGDIAGLEGTVYLYQGDSLIDSAAVKAGKFQFRGQRRGAGRTLPARLARGTAAGIRHAVHPRTRAIFRSRATPRTPQVRHTTGTPANDASDAPIR